MEYDNLNKSYYFNIKRSLVVILGAFILLFQVSKRVEKNVVPQKLPDEIIFLNIENVPITKQGVKRAKPPRPVVPIPVEEPTVPEDLTIEPTELNFDISPPNMPEGDGFYSTIPPRPLEDVFPEYPDSKDQKGVEGKVELSLFVDEKGKVINVQIIKNSTNHKKFAEAAVKAAYKTKFIPAKRDKKYVGVWFRKIYKFASN